MQPLYWRVPEAGPSLVIAATEKILCMVRTPDTSSGATRRHRNGPAARGVIVTATAVYPAREPCLLPTGLGARQARTPPVAAHSQ
jgi:hypothetical protein